MSSIKHHGVYAAPLMMNSNTFFISSYMNMDMYFAECKIRLDRKGFLQSYPTQYLAMIMRSGKRCTRGFFFCQRLHPSIWNAFSYFIANNHILRLLNLTANIRPFCLPGEKTRHTKAISTHGIILFVSWELVMCLAFDIKKGYCTEKKAEWSAWLLTDLPDAMNYLLK